MTAAPPTTRPLVDVGDRATLLALLDLIEVEGWDGAAGAAVLTYARDRVVRPQARRLRRRGADLDQLESCGWCVAWQALRRCAVTRPASPWGLVTVAVRRAMLGEVVAATYDLPVRQAWRRREAGEPPARRVDVDPASVADRHVAPEGVGASPLTAVVERMVELGWDRAELGLIVQWLGSRSGTGRGPGWRALARRAGLPAWQVRRAVVLLAGAPGWRGLVERVGDVGPSALDTPGAYAAIRATLHASHLAPPTAHRRAS